MKITWYGQASFAIESDGGTRIVTDPYDPEKAGFRSFSDPADIVIKSSSNDDFHDNDHLVPKRDGATVIDALEVALGSKEASSHGITFNAIEAMEHLEHPSRDPDQNAMYRFNVDGIEIGHMGDMGKRFFRRAAVLFQGRRCPFEPCRRLSRDFSGRAEPNCRNRASPARHPHALSDSVLQAMRNALHFGIPRVVWRGTRRLCLY